MRLNSVCSVDSARFLFSFRFWGGRGSDSFKLNLSKRMRKVRLNSVCSVDSARFCFQLVFFPGAGFPLKLRPPKGHLDSVASGFGFCVLFFGGRGSDSFKLNQSKKDAREKGV